MEVYVGLISLSPTASLAEEAGRTFHPPDLRQATVLSKAQWLRIQDELKQLDKHRERVRQAEKQREALHLQSEEVVRQWSNTIAVSGLGFCSNGVRKCWLCL